MPSTYQVPILLNDQGLLEICKDVLALPSLTIPQSLLTKGSSIWSEWQSLVTGLEHVFDSVDIVLVGKYLMCPDSYLSVERSLEHASMKCRRRLNLVKVDAEHLEPSTQQSDPAAYHKAWHHVCTASGILVPGGFGQRGAEGMMAAAQWARKNKTPYLGICLGMQLAVVEFARSECNLSLPVATSQEFDDTSSDRVIISMPEHHTGKLGGTMRLGLRDTYWQSDSEWSRLRALYGSGTSSIKERHRHRYEVNPEYISLLEKKGLSFVGKDDSGQRMEVIELRDHPWYVGVQFHPEYLSRVLEPSKPYLGFVAASAGMLKDVTRQTTERDLVRGVEHVAITGEHPAGSTTS